jgi:hypothetical protein
VIRSALVALVVFFVSAAAGAQEVFDATKVAFPSGPTVTAGSAAPTASEPNGSFYHRTNGQWYVRTGGLWVSPVDTNGAITLLGTVTSATGFSTSLNPTTSDTYDLGNPFKLWRKSYISEMSAVLFAKETQQLYGGWLSVSKNAGALAASVTSADTTVDFGTAMTLNQFILIRAADNNTGAITSEFLKVGTLVSGTRYNVTRNLSGLGAKDWATGTPFMVRGVTGDGWLELNAFDTPRLSVYTQGSLYNNSTENLRIGHLTGMPNSSSGIGFYVGDASNYFRYDGSALTLKGYSLTVDSNGVTMPEASSIASKSGFYRYGRSSTFDATSADLFGMAGYRDIAALPFTLGTYLELRNKMVGTTAQPDGDAHVKLTAIGWNHGGAGASTTEANIDVFSNASASGVSVTGAVTTTSSITERSRATPMGEWTTPAYNAANFTASAGTWTVDSGDVISYAYTLVGKTMTVVFDIDTTDVSATPANLLAAIPGGFIAARGTRTMIQVINAGGTAAVGVALVQAGGTSILFASTAAGGGWTTTAGDNTYLFGQITFEIQ